MIDYLSFEIRGMKIIAFKPTNLIVYGRQFYRTDVLTDGYYTGLPMLLTGGFNV